MFLNCNFFKIHLSNHMEGVRESSKLFLGHLIRRERVPKEPEPHHKKVIGLYFEAYFISLNLILNRLTTVEP
jgi:hypothetical protein